MPQHRRVLERGHGHHHVAGRHVHQVKPWISFCINSFSGTCMFAYAVGPLKKIGFLSSWMDEARNVFSVPPSCLSLCLDCCLLCIFSFTCIGGANFARLRRPTPRHHPTPSNRSRQQV